MWDREIEKNSTVWKVEKGKKRKNKVLDCMKLEYYKEVLNFSNIKYYIIFLTIQIPGQQYHAGDSLGTRVLFRTWDFVELEY